MYERTLDDDQVLTLGHEGLLYENSFVFYDKETDSLWIHVTAEAVKGPLKGKSLKIFPSTVTTWEAWKNRYPDTLVLGGDRNEGFMGTFTGLKEDQHKNFGLAVFRPGFVKLYPYEVLESAPILEDDFFGDSVVVSYSSSAGVARVWGRDVDGEPMHFEMVDSSESELVFKDIDTDSVWDGLTGTCIEGAFEGETLRDYICYPILTDRFQAFYPKAPVYERSVGE